MKRTTVANEGSAARDHLANERTFLAWFRTSLGLVGLGLLVERLSATASVSLKLTGLALIVSGGIAALFGLRRYLSVLEHLLEGKFPVERWGAVGLSVVSVVLALLAAVYLLYPGG